MRQVYLLGGALLSAVPPAPAAEPVLTHMHPAGVQRGTEVDVKLTGKFASWPCAVWADDPGIVFTAGKDAGKFHVTVAAGVRPGPHLIRAFNGEGASLLISIVVDAALQTLEAEPNDDYRNPQVLSGTSVVCNGKLDKADDVDSFAVTLKKDQTMITWVEANILAAGFDGMLKIVDDAGTTVAFNHDHVSMDPLIVFKAPRDGRYVIQTMGQKYPASTDIRFASGDDCVYRLHVSTEPYVRNTWPLAIQRGKKTKVALEGWNLSSTEAEVEEAMPPSFPVTFSGVPEVIETGGPQMLEIPSAVSGRLVQPGAEDRYSFTAAKDTVLILSVSGAAFGSVIDPWLKVLGGDGKVLASNDDDGGGEESRLQWTVPADGTYTVAVGDIPRRGGDGIYYRLLIEKPVPDAAASIAAHTFKLEAGKSAEIKASVSLANGFHSRLKLVVTGLPAGISAAEVEVPEKGGETVLKLTADAGAAAVSQPFRLLLREVEGGKERPVRYSLTTPGENNGVPQGFSRLLINQTDQLWLTVTSPPPPPPPAPPAAAPAK